VNNIKKIIIILMTSIILLCSVSCTCTSVNGRLESACYGDIIPCANVTYNLGNVDTWWDSVFVENIYAGNIYSSNMTSANITGGGTMGTISQWTSPSNLNNSPITHLGGILDFDGHALVDVADPTNNQDVATKHYVDVSGNITGVGTSGNITMWADNDTVKDSLISQVGNTISMNGSTLTGLAEPVNDSDAVTKYYVDHSWGVYEPPDFLTAIGMGLVPNAIAGSKIGYNSDIGITPETVWPVSTSYVFPTGAIQMEVVSSSASDTSASATNAKSVIVYYLDSNYAEKNTIVNLNGTTPVNTSVSDIYRVNHYRLYTVGTTGIAAGNIDIRSVGGGIIYGRIEAGFTRGRSLVYCVPEGKTLYITSIKYSSGSGNKQATVRFTTRTNYDNLRSINLTPANFYMPYNETILQDNVVWGQINPPIRVPEHTDVRIDVVSDVAGAKGSTETWGFLIVE
jgi:hypothetical protein